MYFTTSYGSVKGLMTGAVFSLQILLAPIIGFSGGQVATHVVPDV